MLNSLTEKQIQTLKNSIAYVFPKDSPELIRELTDMSKPYPYSLSASNKFMIMLRGCFEKAGVINFYEGTTTAANQKELGLLVEFEALVDKTMRYHYYIAFMSLLLNSSNATRILNEFYRKIRHNATLLVH